MRKSAWSRAVWILRAAECRNESWSSSVQLHEKYSEPGYTDPESGVIATGHWNNHTRWDEATQTFATTDDTPGRVSKLLEKAGVELEWGDEWTSCEDCGGLFRTSPDRHSWHMAGVIEGGACVCHNCIDPVEHLEGLEGKGRYVETVVDPAEHGYAQLEIGFPTCAAKDQAEELRKQGFTRFIISNDTTVFVHKDDPALAAHYLEQVVNNDPA
jgi:hypothetical protein